MPWSFLRKRVHKPACGGAVRGVTNNVLNEPLRLGLRAGIGMAAIAVLDALLLPWWPLPLLAGPLGALAVVLVCLHESDIAQPWRVLSSHLLAAAVGLACRITVALWSPSAAMVLAVGGTVMLMALWQRVHPPAGAVALVALYQPASEAQAPWVLLNAPLAAGVLLGAVHLIARCEGLVWPPNDRDNEAPHDPGIDEQSDVA